ncbi:MAG: deoxyribodipyrimidine photo-lyase, partial [Aquabacterium sp.]|nr:deoxyribodipyrimidine photo-lyase [Aquabacterium sp.]
MSESNVSALVWFRRDLRCTDHAALFHALKQNRRVWCAFVFDSDILEPLPRQDRRVAFIRDSLVELDQGLRELALKAGVPQPERVGLIVRYGSARSVIPQLAGELGVQSVYANHDDEPDAQDRDAQVRGRLSNLGVALYTLKDHVIFERNEVLTGNDTPYGV